MDTDINIFTITKYKDGTSKRGSFNKLDRDLKNSYLIGYHIKKRLFILTSVVNYNKALSDGLTPAQSVETIDQNRGQEDFCFLGLRTAWGIQAQSFRDLFGTSVEDQFGSIIEKLCEQGLLQVVPGGYTLTALGAKHGNYVFEQFIRD